MLRKVEPSSAPSFERVVETDGCSVPTAGQLLDEFERLIGEAAKSGSMEMEIE
jgi:hypothetical protein